MNALRRSVLVLLLALATAGAPAGESFDLASLMAALAARGDAEAAFEEELHLRTLERPLASSGTLHWRSGALEKRTLRPRAETLRYVDGVASAERGGRRTRLDLRRSPEALVLVEGLRAVLAGDAAALEELFEHELTGAAATWTLSLRPREPRARAVLETLRIEGGGTELTRIELRRANGDRTVTRVLPLTDAP